MTDSRPPVYYVLFHYPGERWEKGVPFPEQPGTALHVPYMSDLREKGLILMGGPHLDDRSESGSHIGMMVCSASSPEEAQRLAEDDPAVKERYLRVEVRPWMVAMR